MVKYRNHHPTDIATKAINIKGAELNDRQGCVSVFCFFNGGISYDIINTVSHLPNIISYKYYPNQLDQFAKAPTETPRPRRRVHSTLIPFCIYRERSGGRVGQQQKLYCNRQQVLNSRSICCYYYYYHWIEEVREVESFISK